MQSAGGSSSRYTPALDRDSKAAKKQGGVVDREGASCASKANDKWGGRGGMHNSHFACLQKRGMPAGCTKTAYKTARHPAAEAARIVG